MIGFQRAAFGGSPGSFGGLVDISGAAAGQIKFPSTQNASTNANTLDDYREADHVSDVNGYSAPPSITFKITKVGRQVTLLWPQITGTSNATTKQSATALPAAYRPAQQVNFIVRCADNGGSSTAGLFQIDTAGVIDMQPTPGAAWTASGTATISAGSVSYNI